MKVSNLHPDPLLCPLIDRYWSWENEPQLPSMMLGTGSELMLHYGDRLASPASTLLPRSFLISPKTCRFTPQASGITGFLSVRFRAGALRHFCAMPVCEIIDRPLDIDELWGKAGVELEERILHAPDLASRVALLDSFLLTMLQRYRKPERWLDRSVQALYYRTSPLDAVTAAAPVSVRSFQQAFKQNVGISAKHFQKIARFESVLRQLLLEKRSDYLGLALDRGYFDQSHFIRDCREFTGQTPLSYLQERNFSAHFYNRRLGQ